MSLVNPYLDFFYSLPAAFRRDASLVGYAAVELFLPDWLAVKEAIARHFAWAVPNDQAIATMQKHTRKVLEVGAGNGYWAWLMRQAGITVDAIDVNPPPFTWSEVRRGDERIAHAYPDRALFLCWPPWANPMATNALLAYRGEQVIYVGEWLGGSADANFFSLLVVWFECVDVVAIPRWCVGFPP